MKPLKFLTLLCAFFMVFVLSGCGTIQGTNAAQPKSTPTVTQPAPTPTANPLLKEFGQTETYEDGVTISVSTASPYQPSDNAVGAVDGQAIVKFTITVTNNSTKTLNIGGFPIATSGGQQAATITDLEAQVGDTPYAPLLTGQSLSWVQAYSVADPNNITIAYQPGDEYKQAIFTSKV